jgi:hypothetical protein
MGHLLVSGQWSDPPQNQLLVPFYEHHTSPFPIRVPNISTLFVDDACKMIFLNFAYKLN